MSIGPLHNTVLLDNAASRNITPAANGGMSTTGSIATLVTLCALPIILPYLPTIGEVAIRVVSAPIVALHRIIALNYTLFKPNPHHTHDFILSAIKANLLFWKGFIFDHFSLSTTNCECFREGREIANRAYARMLLYVWQGHNWTEETEQALIHQRVFFPELYECDFDLDLITHNHLWNLLAPAIFPSMNFDPEPFPIGEMTATQPQQPGPTACLPIEPREPKFDPFYIRNEYFQNMVRNVEIPPLPQGARLHALFDQFWPHINRSWDNNVQINDDNVMRSKVATITSVRNFLNSIDQEAANDFAGLYCAEAMRTIRKALGNVFSHFMERKLLIDEMAESSQKQKALNLWLLEGRSFVMALGANCNHCIDRKLCDAIIFFQRYVIKKPCSIDDVDNSRLETLASDLLKEHRQELIQHICTNSIETNEHHASTERYVKSQLNRELGLGLPAAFDAHDALTTYAIQNKVQEVRHIFYQLYTPQSIVRDFIRKISKQMNESHNQIYNKIVEWFERQEHPKSAEDIFDTESMVFKEDAIIELLIHLGVIAR
jgi:hypothetical protein